MILIVPWSWNTEFTSALANRGETYGRMGQYEEALNDFNRALELQPEFASALGGRGETYRLLDCYEEALTDFNHARGVGT